jgi:Amt family ammonium transporter
MAIGGIAGAACLWAVTWLKRVAGYDDSLDVFGVHCLGGVLGALLTAVFCAPALGGTGVYDYVANAVGEYSIARQLASQLTAVAITLAWSAAVAAASFKLVDRAIGLRVSRETEHEGLDTPQHGERAYT